MTSHKNLKLGKFSKDKFGSLQGTIKGLGIGSTEVMAQDMLSQEGRPYLKLIADPFGIAYEVGAAFIKEKDGITYYSVSLDSPLFPNAISAVLFPDRDNIGTFNLLWNRADSSKQSIDSTPNNGLGRRYMGASATP